MRAALALLALSAFAAEHRGQVTFNGLPVPGAVVTAVRGGASVETVTDSQGLYSFPDLADGAWTIDVRMTGFAPAKQEISVAPDAPANQWALKMLPLDQIRAAIIQPAPVAAAAAPVVHERDTSEGLLINGSTVNGAASPFAQLASFGNNRAGRRGLYTGGIGMILDNSALDARPYSLTGQNTPRPAYDRLTGLVSLGGPLRIPHLLHNGPFFFVGYQWTRTSNDNSLPGLVPTEAQRSGMLVSGVIPQDRITPQARALLNLYPLPNFTGDARYNYQVPIRTATHQDALQSRLDKTINARNQIYGAFGFQSTRMDDPNLFGFLDTTDMLGMIGNANWQHRLGQQWFMNLGYQFSRLATHVRPWFADRANISGRAGISGNDQDPREWGPPNLVFASGTAGLSDANASFDRNQTSRFSATVLWNRAEHNVTFGGDFRRQEFNYLSQQDPRGTLTFTGAATGSDFGDFLQGIPDASSIAFGNADKYFRESVWDAYINDDWRVSPELTVNAGVRWEYGAPITELYDRLVNLDIAPGFTAAAPVLAGDSRYPASLLHPDRSGFEPRVGVAWRPVGGSSLVLRAGYGVYYDTSVYQTIALDMAQQPPFSKTVNLQNSADNPLSLANPFPAPHTPIANTFAVDPHFRVGYAQNWQFSAQRDLPWSLQLTATYIGVKGTRGAQEFLPNTYPPGAGNPCPACPVGFVYLTSNGNSTREAAQIQLRRRLHSGLAATLEYTYAKALDDDAWLGGQGAVLSTQPPTAQNAPENGATVAFGASGPAAPAIAQNWRDLSAERGPSTFDQRHLLSAQIQYTSGMGLRGGALMSGWKGALLKEWTVATQIAAGTGLPETPIYLAPVPGTAVTGTIRPEYIGAHLYAPPPPGQWGNAGRGTITGPAQFSLNASLGRTFRLSDRLNLDLRVDSTNALNHVSFTAWNTVINNAQFGLPVAANAMRSLQTTLRVRF
ncbi:MAG TPA: carboxypeptidase regulatory-like domain-containing protein [Bryobacteraceae bacterium]|nr:carboxypeptidase regulatory-like domain-containing protein [Bryobacteraceae bacterium]